MNCSSPWMSASGPTRLRAEAIRRHAAAFHGSICRSSPFRQRLSEISDRIEARSVVESRAVQFPARRWGGVVSLTGIVVGIALATLAGQARQGGASRTTAKPYTTWQSYAGGAHSSQYSALDQINKRNVAKLEVAWSFPITGNSIFN